MARISPSAPHDAVFKQFLTHPETARDFLEIHLPEHLLKLCDLKTLRLESGSFIEENLQARHSDVLWSVQTRYGAGYVYALLEHQSTPDKQMTFRLMRYALAAMQRHLDAGNEKLPLVIPILFYHGAVSPYPFSMCWLDAFENPRLAQQLYAQEFLLVDVTVISDDSILTHRRVALLEFLQKHIRARDLMAFHEHLVSLLLEGYTTGQQLRTAINYLVQAGNTVDHGALIRLLANKAPQHKGILMTIAEQLRQEGHGKGVLQGRSEGRQEATIRIALAMLNQGMERAQIIQLTGLSEEAFDALVLS
mgnify:FL=1